MNINLIFKYQKNLTNQIFKVMIYDSNNNLILDSYTNNQGLINCTLNKEIYKVNIFANHLSFSCQKSLTININQHTPKNMIFIFDIIPRTHQIKIRFTDFYYPQLPIEKGKINLWQKNT